MVQWYRVIPVITQVHHANADRKANERARALDDGEAVKESGRGLHRVKREDLRVAVPLLAVDGGLLALRRAVDDAARVALVGQQRGALVRGELELRVRVLRLHRRLILLRLEELREHVSDKL